MGRKYVDWWAKYNEYMRSEKWFEKRERILKRDKGKCVLCNKDATQVHHNTYERFGGKERLSDLVSLCKRCHEQHHGRVIHVTEKTKELVFDSEFIGDEYIFTGREVYEGLFFMKYGEMPGTPSSTGMANIIKIREALGEDSDG